MNTTRFGLAVLALMALGGCSGSPYEEGLETSGDVDRKDGAKKEQDPGAGGTTNLAQPGFKMGVVTGRIYDDMVKNLGKTLGDMRALGVNVMRLEIEGTDYRSYATIAEAASTRYGVDTLALVSEAAVSDPLEVDDITWFDQTFVPRYIARVDALMAAIPSLQYVEVWNEPDVYGFFIGYPNGTPNPRTGKPMPSQAERARRYGLLVTRVFEHYDQIRRKGQRAPTIVAGDFSRQDEPRLHDLVWNSDAVTNHRKGYRPVVGLPDGPPVDILSIHGYGDKNKMPDEQGYAYVGTLEDGINAFLGWQFAENVQGNTSLVKNAPVWYTEIGVGSKTFGRDGQARALRTTFDILKRHGEIQAAFWYSYRDDEPGGGEGNTNGLRGNSTEQATLCAGTYGERTLPYAKHPSWDAFADVSGARGRVTFADVPQCHWAHDTIEALYARGITKGCDGGANFCESQNLKVKELDAFVRRCEGDLNAGVDGDSPDALRVDVALRLYKPVANPTYKGYFVDVPQAANNANHWVEIESLKDRRIGQGTDAGNGQRAFNPTTKLTRSEMATFLARAYGFESDLK